MELRAGKKVTSKRLLYPGYVMVEMEMNDELWHAVKSTPRVTGFVGGGNSPVPSWKRATKDPGNIRGALRFRIQRRTIESAR